MRRGLSPGRRKSITSLIKRATPFLSSSDTATALMLARMMRMMRISMNSLMMRRTAKRENKGSSRNRKKE